MTDTSHLIDPHRPWIRDERDNPHDMNWVQTLFNPFGMTGKLHFSRAWTFMFMGRLLLYIVPVFCVFIAGLAGARIPGAWKPLDFFPLPVPALLVPFFIFTIVTVFTSWIAHIRRLADANRSTFLAIIVLIPLMLGLGGFAMGVGQGIAEYQKMTQGPAQPAAAAPAAPAETADGAAGEEASTDAEGETEEAEAESAEGTAAASNQQQARQQQRQQGPRRRGPPPTQMEMALGSGLGTAMLFWSVPSFFVMLWTLLYVARLPNGGVGEFRTGSDLTVEEQKPKAYEAAV